MNYRTRIQATPENEPLTIAEAKSHLRVDADDENSVIEMMIAAVRAEAETHTNRFFITQSIDVFFSGFPCSRELVIPVSPAQSLTHVKYRDAAGAEQTLSSSYYTFDNSGIDEARIVLKDGYSWPDTDNNANPVFIRVVAGYGDTGDSVPADLKIGMLLLLGHRFENRQDVVTGAMVNTIPNASAAIFERYRFVRF